MIGFIRNLFAKYVGRTVVGRVASSMVDKIVFVIGSNLVLFGAPPEIVGLLGQWGALTLQIVTLLGPVATTIAKKMMEKPLPQPPPGEKISSVTIETLPKAEAPRKPMVTMLPAAVGPVNTIGLGNPE